MYAHIKISILLHPPSFNVNAPLFVCLLPATGCALEWVSVCMWMVSVILTDVLYSVTIWIFKNNPHDLWCSHHSFPYKCCKINGSGSVLFCPPWLFDSKWMLYLITLVCPHFSHWLWVPPQSSCTILMFHQHLPGQRFVASVDILALLSMLFVIRKPLFLAMLAMTGCPLFLDKENILSKQPIPEKKFFKFIVYSISNCLTYSFVCFFAGIKIIWYVGFAFAGIKIIWHVDFVFSHATISVIACRSLFAVQFWLSATCLVCWVKLPVSCFVVYYLSHNS